MFQDIYDHLHLPHQQRLSENERKEAEGYIKMKVDKKLLQQHLSEKTGKVVTLKDISNVQTSIRESSDRNDLGALTTQLHAIEGKAFGTKQYYDHILCNC